jgi:hypothetical protein
MQRMTRFSFQSWVLRQLFFSFPKKGRRPFFSKLICRETSVLSVVSPKTLHTRDARALFPPDNTNLRERWRPS